MIRAVLVFGVFAFGVGCSSMPDVLEKDALETTMALEEHAADRETDFIKDYANVTRLDDERVYEPLLDERLSDSLIIVDDEASQFSDRQNKRDSEIVIVKPATVFQDIYFDFDRRVPQQRMLKRLTAQAAWLRNHVTAEVVVAGHCDTRGSREYNVVLGEKRAQWIKSFFMKSGVSGERIALISYGKEQPTCLVVTKACHSKNRRAQISLQ